MSARPELSLLSQRVARDLEVVFGLTEDSCRRCASFKVLAHRENEGLGHCTIKRGTVRGGDICERFLLKYRLRT